MNYLLVVQVFIRIPTGLLWQDLQLTPPHQARLRGKGRKERLVPLWRETADA